MDVTYNLYNSGGSRPSDNGGGGGHPDPEIRGAGAVSKNFFSALRASVWPKKRGGGGEGGRTPPLDPPLHKVVTCINIG